MSKTLELLKEFIRCPSLTPHDAGCQDIIANRLSESGFQVERMRFEEVDNLWARIGQQEPLMVFAGHTDVVHPGPLEAWRSPPFEPTEREGYLIGRGATDMKSGLAAMIVAAENFLRENPHFSGSLAFLITSDEEGPTNLNGTQKVIQTLLARQEKITYCIIGEASSEKILGDQIRVGRRGSLNGKIIIHGKQGHIAYPHLAENPIHRAACAIAEITRITWDQGNEFFPPTTFQISNINAGTGASNVIPGTLEMLFNFRFSTAISLDELQKRFTEVFMNHSLDFDLKWDLSGLPFLTPVGKLIQLTEETIKEIQGIDTRLSTGGGTSDGRFIALTGAEVLELGPVNTTAHQIDEHVKIADLEPLTALYQTLLHKIFTQ